MAESLQWFEVRGWRIEAENQKDQPHSSEVAEIAGLQPLTSNLLILILLTTLSFQL